MRRQLPSGANVWYVIICILTLGGAYFSKIVIMKAIIDSQKPRPDNA